jgi:hypothetical protein
MPNSETAALEQLPLARLKRDRPGIRASVYKLRSRVEAELLASGGGTIVTTVRLASACTYYRWYLKAEEREYLLRDSLTLAEWTAIGDRATKWLEKCVGLLVDLGLDKPLAARLVEAESQQMKQMWDDLYSGRLDAKPANGPSAAASGQPVAEDSVGAAIQTLDSGLPSGAQDRGSNGPESASEPSPSADGAENGPPPAG